jgi:hypothetical protein
MVGKSSDMKASWKTVILIILSFVFSFSVSACATRITKTYDGPALSKNDISMVVVVTRKSAVTIPTGLKVASFLLAMPDTYHNLYISKIDDNNNYAGHIIYEMLPGEHVITFKVQKEYTTHWQGKQKTEFTDLNVQNTINLDCKAGHILLIDFELDKDTLNLLPKDVTNDPEYKKIMDNR